MLRRGGSGAAGGAFRGEEVGTGVTVGRGSPGVGPALSGGRSGHEMPQGVIKIFQSFGFVPSAVQGRAGTEGSGVLMGWSRGRGMKFNRMESEVVCLGREETFHCKASASARPRWCQLAERTAGSYQQDTAVRRANMNHELSDPWERREPGLGTNVCVSSHLHSGEISLGWNCPFGDGE